MGNKRLLRRSYVENGKIDLPPSRVAIENITITGSVFST